MIKNKKNNPFDYEKNKANIYIDSNESVRKLKPEHVTKSEEEDIVRNKKRHHADLDDL